MGDGTTLTGAEYPAGHRLGDFEIQAVAGRGAMGVVYRALELRLERTVALKVVAPGWADDVDFRARFEREARAAAGLSHPHIVSVHAAGEIDDVLYIAMQWVDGGDLRHQIEMHGPLRPDVAVRVVKQMADALDAAHAAGVLHRDVKPANILTRDMPAGLHAYLTDFGITRHFMGLRDGEKSLTETGHVVGTPGFLAPEQIRGREADGRADLYALGCVLFEVLTGQPPFPWEGRVPTLVAHVSAKRPLVSAVNPRLGTAFDEILQRAIAISPEDRFPDGASLAAALDLAERSGVPLPRVRPLPELPKLDVPRRRVADGDGSSPATTRRIVIGIEDVSPVSVPRARSKRIIPASDVAREVAAGGRHTAPKVRPSPARRDPASPLRAARRGHINAVMLLIAAVIFVVVMVIAASSGRRSGGRDSATRTLGRSEQTALGENETTASTSFAPQAGILRVLRTYERGLDSHSAEVMGSTLAEDVRRTARGRAEPCATPRDGVLYYYRTRVFPAITHFRFVGLGADTIQAPSNGIASSVRTSVVTTTADAETHPGKVTFGLRKSGDWKIYLIEESGC